MTRRFRKARVFVIILLAFLSGSIYGSCQKRPMPPFIVPILRIDPSAVIESRNNQFHRTEKGLDINLRSDYFFAYADGRPSQMINVSGIISFQLEDGSIINGDLKAYGVIFIKTEDGKIKAIEATGSVEWSSNGKVVFGDKLIYVLDEKKITVTGNPARLLDFSDPCYDMKGETIIIDEAEGTITIRGEKEKTEVKLIDCPTNQQQENNEENNEEVATTSFLFIILGFTHFRTIKNGQMLSHHFDTKTKSHLPTH